MREESEHVKLIGPAIRAAAAKPANSCKIQEVSWGPNQKLKSSQNWVACWANTEAESVGITFNAQVCPWCGIV